MDRDIEPGESDDEKLRQLAVDRRLLEEPRMEATGVLEFPHRPHPPSQPGAAGRKSSGDAVSMLMSSSSLSSLSARRISSSSGIARRSTSIVEHRQPSRTALAPPAS
jgi:hypothetical protein